MAVRPTCWMLLCVLPISVTLMFIKKSLSGAEWSFVFAFFLYETNHSKHLSLGLYRVAPWWASAQFWFQLGVGFPRVVSSRMEHAWWNSEFQTFSSNFHPITATCSFQMDSSSWPLFFLFNNSHEASELESDVSRFWWEGMSRSTFDCFAWNICTKRVIEITPKCSIQAQI